MKSFSTENKKIHCPYCQAVSAFYFPYHSRTYYHCKTCGLIFAKSNKDLEAAMAYYQDFYFDDYTEDQISGSRANIFNHILEFLDGYKNSGTLLDLGCGCGFFLKEAKARGWKVLGVDPSRKSIAYARSLIGGDVAVCGTLDDVSPHRLFDVITLINVLDHMVDACLQLQKAKAALAPEGLLYLRFPNGSFHSFLMRFSLMFSSKQFMSPFLIFHEYAITQKAIRRCLEDLGFIDIQVANSYLTGSNFCYKDWAFSKLTMKFVSSLIWGFVQVLEKLSGGRWLWGPSLQVVARNNK